ncbi:MAG: hypothetical protein AAF251_02810 [Pseudomonadota bacterium]
MRFTVLAKMGALLALVGGLTACSDNAAADLTVTDSIEPQSDASPAPRWPVSKPPRLVSRVPNVLAPEILNLDLCSVDRSECTLSDSLERCELVYGIEVLFETTRQHGFLALIDKNGSAHHLRLQRRDGEGSAGGEFESADGRLSATLKTRFSDLPRGRATGPGMMGELLVVLDGKRLVYPFPNPKDTLVGPLDCWRNGEKTR